MSHLLYRNTVIRKKYCAVWKRREKWINEGKDEILQLSQLSIIVDFVQMFKSNEENERKTKQKRGTNQFGYEKEKPKNENQNCWRDVSEGRAYRQHPLRLGPHTTNYADYGFLSIQASTAPLSCCESPFAVICCRHNNLHIRRIVIEVDVRIVAPNTDQLSPFQHRLALAEDQAPAPDKHETNTSMSSFLSPKMHSQLIHIRSKHVVNWKDAFISILPIR